MHESIIRIELNGYKEPEKNLELKEIDFQLILNSWKDKKRERVLKRKIKIDYKIELKRRNDEQIGMT
jgi:hypothetical protein